MAPDIYAHRFTRVCFFLFVSATRSQKIVARYSSHWQFCDVLVWRVALKSCVHLASIHFAHTGCLSLWVRYVYIKCPSY